MIPSRPVDDLVQARGSCYGSRAIALLLLTQLSVNVAFMTLAWTD